MKLWQKVTLGLVLGIVLGVFYPEYVSYVKPLGIAFMRMIMMMVYPLIFFSLVGGITSMNNPSSLKKMGVKAVIAFLATSLLAIMLGIGIALVIKPGVGAHVHFILEPSNFKTANFDLIDFIVNFIPDNVVEAFAKGKLLQIVFFAIFTGITINQLGASVAPLTNFCHIVLKVILKMIAVIIQLSPYAAFALTAWLVGTNGISMMIHMSKLILVVILGMGIQYLIFGILIYAFCRISPIPFYKKSVEYQVIAFSTSSSKATLGTAMQVCREKLGISDSTTCFVMPLGVSLNMNGFAMNLALTTVFFAQLMGVTLNYHDYFIISITSLIGSIGAAGIPGASLIMLPMVLSAVNLPTEGIAIIAGIDRLLDMLRTTINITGDATITLIVDESESTFNKEKYFS